MAISSDIAAGPGWARRTFGNPLLVGFIFLLVSVFFVFYLSAPDEGWDGSIANWPLKNQYLIGVCFLFDLLLFGIAMVLFEREDKRRQQAACPRCGHSWEIKEGLGVKPQEQMPNWDSCPGSGAPM